MIIRSLIGLTTTLLLIIAGCATEHSGDAARSVVEAKFAAVSRHAVADIVALYSPSAKLSAPDFCKARSGRDDVRRTYQTLFEQFPDVTVNGLEYLARGERVAVKFVVSSRIPNKTFDVPIMNFFTVRDGLIESDEGLFDTRGRACSP